jgi:hypothetical protein
MARFTLALAGVALAAVVVVAQSRLSSHTLLGTVTDRSGTPLPGVTVDLNRPGETTGMVRTVVTDSNGRYRIERILPGAYVLTLRLSGFATAIRDLEIGGGPTEFEYDVQLTTAVGTAVPAPQVAKRVVCGMTLITPPLDVDRGIYGPKAPPAETQQVKPAIRAIQPTLCWEPSTDRAPVRPTR